MLIRASQFPNSNSIVSDKSNSYELVISTFGQKPSDFSFTQSSVDRSSASSLVCRIGLDDYQWLQLFPGLLNQYPDKTVTAQVAELIENGIVGVYKLPSIKSAAAIPFNDKTAYKFLPEIARQYLPNPFKFEKFNSTAKAQAVVNGIKWTSEYLYRALENVGVDTEILQKVQSNGNKNLDFGKQELIKYLADGKAGVYKVERVTASPAKETKAELVPLRTNDKPPPLAPETPKQEEKKTDFSQRKGVEPKSLDDAANRLDSMKGEIKNNGHQNKYTDKELVAMAKSGSVANERFHVRFMEYGYLERNNKAGSMGAPMPGKGAKYWSTTFDQIEDADSNPEIICKKLGIEYNPESEYTMIIIDTEKALPITDAKTLVPTFENISEFANEELSDDFPPAVTDKIMTPEFQAEYKKHHAAAVKSKMLNGEGDKNPEHFDDYLQSSGLSMDEQNAMRQRFAMQNSVGNNPHFLGNGLTANLNGDQEFGVVETLNLERKKVDLDQLVKADAIRLQKLG